VVNPSAVFRFRRASLRLIAPVALAAWALQPRASAGENAPDSNSPEVRAIFEKSRDAVVKIQAVDEHGPLSGTGFFIDPNGTLYTSYTIGGESHDIVVFHAGERSRAKRLLADSRSGVALLTIEKRTPFLPTGAADGLTVASRVVVIGYPMDLPLAPEAGAVGGFDVKYLGRYFATAHIRANVNVQRGEGGAPLLNLKGEVVGIVISSLETANGCFALPIEAAEKIRKDFMRFGETHPGWLGVTVNSMNAGPGAPVDELAKDAPAAQAGIKKGDVLLQVGRTGIRSPEDIFTASFYLTAGDEVPVTLLRNGEKLTLRVHPELHPTAKRDTAQALAPPPGGAIPLKPGE
jgi:serine protease Do